MPGHDLAKAWLVRHADFRSVYPQKGNVFFKGRSEADIQRARLMLQLLA